jgi:hypothetical protein
MAGAEGRWRVVVSVGPAQPELRAALAPLPPRARAERLRQLALVGLSTLHGAATAPMLAPPAQTAEPRFGLDQRRERLLRSLAAGANDLSD